MSTHSECRYTGCYDCRADGVAKFAKRLLANLEPYKKRGRSLDGWNMLVLELEKAEKHEFELEA